MCLRAWAGSQGLPSPAISRLTSSQTGRSAALLCKRLPMKLPEKAVMDIAGGVKVSMALVVTHGAKKELASFPCDPLSRLVREPHALATTTRAILGRAMGIDFDADYSYRIRLFFRQLIDFAFQLIGLFTIQSP